MSLLYRHRQFLILLSILFLGVVSGVFFTRDVVAKTSPPIRQVGFTTYDRLPANAKGVLFTSIPDSYESLVMGWIGKSGKLVQNIQASFPSEPFQIVEGGSEKSLEVEILRDRQYTHYYRLVDKVLKACIYQALENSNKPECQSKEIVNIRDDGNLQRLLKQGKVEDLSSAFFYGLNSAWIRPKSGFKVGKTYVFKYFGLDAQERFSWQQREIHLTVGPAIDPLSFENIRLVPAGQKRIVEIYPAHGRESDLLSYQSTVQDIRFDLPTELEPYRQILVYGISHQIEGNPVLGRGTSGIHYRPCFDCHWPPIGPVRGESQSELLSSCTARKNAELPAQVWGKVQFLELSDREYETPKLAQQFQNEEGRTCYGLEFFKRALASRYNVFIEKMVCDLAQGPIGDLNVKEFLPSLTELARSENQEIKSCSARALQKLTEHEHLGVKQD